MQKVSSDMVFDNNVPVECIKQHIVHEMVEFLKPLIEWGVEDDESNPFKKHMYGNIYVAKKSSNKSKVSSGGYRKLSETLYKAKRKNWRELSEDEWWVEGAAFYGKRDCYILTNIKVTDEWENSEIGADVVGYIVDPKTLRQWIGITDKDDKKIFVGHVVEVNESTLDGEVQISTVKIYPGYKELMRLEYANELKIIGDSFVEE